MLDRQMVEIVACTGQTDGGDCGLCWTDRCWRWRPVLDRQMLEMAACGGQTDGGDVGGDGGPRMVEIAACAGQTDVGDCGLWALCWTDR